MPRERVRRQRVRVVASLGLFAAAWIGSASLAQPTAAGPPFEVTPYVSISALPDVAIRPDGGFIVVWQADGYWSSVFGQRYDRSGRLLDSNPVLLGGNGTGLRDGNLPRLGMTPMGAFVVAWQGTDYSYRTDVRARRFDADGVPREDEFRVTDRINSSFNAGGFSLDVAPDGSFVVAWPDLDGELSGQRFDASGAPLGLELVVNTETARTQLHPSVAMDARGGFLVTWDTSSIGARYHGVFGQRYAGDGARLGGQFQVHTGSGEGHGYPAAALAPDGSAVVVWHGNVNQARRDILAQRFDGAGRRLGAPFVVNTRTDGDQFRPALAMGVDGGFLIAWENSGNSDRPEGVRAQFFDSSGAKLGGELQVSTDNAGIPSRVAVAVGEDGSAVIVWQTSVAFGGRPAVFARRYAGVVDHGDLDEDGVSDDVDNCPSIWNAFQEDVNVDGYGDECVSPDAFISSTAEIGADPFIGRGAVLEDHVSIGDRAWIGEQTLLMSKMRAGDHFSAHAFSVIGSRSQLGNRVSIGESTRLEADVIVGDDVSIGDHAQAKRNVVIGNGATIGPLVSLFAGARVGAGATVEMGARIAKRAVVRPGAVVPAGTTVAAGATFP